MVDQAFACPEIDQVSASTMAVNAGSRRVLEKVGLRHSESWVQEWEDPVDGWERGEVRYDVTREEWAG